MIVAIGENVAVKPIKVSDKTDGGVILPDEHRDRKQHKTSRGEIVSLGSWAFHAGNSKLPEAPKVGDVVIYPTYEGILETDASGAEIRIIQDSDVKGVVS